MSTFRLELVEPAKPRKVRPLPPGWMRVAKGGVVAERIVTRPVGSIVAAVEPGVHCWTRLEDWWALDLTRDGRALGSWRGSYRGSVIDGALAADAALLQLLPMLDRIAAAGERCEACLAVSPHPFAGRSTPCPWCGTTWVAGTAWDAERDSLEAVGWVWSGCGLVPGEVA